MSLQTRRCWRAVGCFVDGPKEIAPPERVRMPYGVLTTRESFGSATSATAIRTVTDHASRYRLMCEPWNPTRISSLKYGL
jgi:hypothetical protein